MQSYLKSYFSLNFYYLFFFFNDTATTEIYTLSLHDALPMLPLPPAFSTYSTLPCTVRLLGSVPPDAVRLARDSPAGPTSNTETSFEPAFTANSRRPSSLRATAPCEPSPAPVPVPPVAIVPAAVSVPSALRLKTATALPATWFVSV